jgi:hypothetical protein
MKPFKLIIAMLACFALVSLTTAAFAKEHGQEMTITGTAMCAKCAMHQGDKCDTVVKCMENGKEVMYHLTGKEVKEFHKSICNKAEGAKVTVTGKVKEKDGKMMMEATKIEAMK